MKGVPTAEEQVRFLTNVQRVFDEGVFVSTYKFALLLSIADVCVEHGTDSGESMRIGTGLIGEKFLEYYWRQAKPFTTSAGAQILRQATGAPATILTLLQKTMEDGYSSLAQVKRAGRFYSRLLGKVTSTVEEMPLWKLQTVATTALPFLYRKSERLHEVELLPGVMFCFRKFHTLLSDLVRSAWAGFVRSRNLTALGSATDLDEFLFGTERASPARLTPFFADLQNGRCFYCGRRLTRNGGHIDHFIPWSKYPVDLGHNFVLADSGCNSAKAQHIASVEHLANWVKRNTMTEEPLKKEFNRHHLAHDAAASFHVARWAYAGTATSGGLTWFRAKDFRPLPADWESRFTST
jgi:hypothetical protein